MYKLVSPFENTRWSYNNGYYIFDFDVCLLKKEDMRKYKLIDKQGKDIYINIEDCLKQM